MYVNTLRLTVRHDEDDATRAILPIVGAARATRYERDAQLAFLEAGVKLVAGPDVPALTATDGTTLADALAEVAELSVVSFGCADCAAAAGVDPSAATLERLEWLPSTDVRLPLHDCGRKGAGAATQKVTVADQQREQRVFDEFVGRTTIGADRGQG